MTEKRCTKCDAIKPLTAFGIVKARQEKGWKQFHRAYCKSCDAKRNKTHRDSHAEQLRATGLKYRHTHREELRRRDLAYRQPRREILAAAQRARIWTRKCEVIAHYGAQCTCCGETSMYFLELDHINGGGNQQRKQLKLTGGYHFYTYLKAHGYPSGYRVPCSNCNKALAMYGFCPHQKDMIQALQALKR